ncbi:MAG: SPFH domain-containing protein [Pirellulaceae bacterium]
MIGCSDQSRVRRLQRIHIRQTSLRLAPQSVLLRDGVVFNVVGVLVYRIADAYKALFEIAELPAAMGDVGAGKLREVVSGKTFAEMWDILALRAAIIEQLRVQEEQVGSGGDRLPLGERRASEHGVSRVALSQDRTSTHWPVVRRDHAPASRLPELCGGSDPAISARANEPFKFY